EDWKFYYVGMFVDCDIVMRFCGGGIGHKSTCMATDQFLSDHDHREQNHEGEEGSTADEDDDLARESEDEIEPGIKDDPEDERDYGYTRKQAIEDEDANEWQDDNEDLLDNELGREDGEDEDEDLGFREF
ncbi:hypothetical protein L208DRAFT_1541333, partial [Tricholoma matsutake]